MGFRFSPGCTCCNCCNDFAKNHLEFDVDFGAGLSNGLCTNCENFSGLQTVQINLFYEVSDNCIFIIPHSSNSIIFGNIEILGGPCDSAGKTSISPLIPCKWGCPCSTNGTNSLYAYDRVAIGLFEIFILNPHKSFFGPPPIYQNEKCVIAATLQINQGSTLENTYYAQQVWYKEIDISDWNKVIGIPIELPKYTDASSQGGIWKNTICLYNDGNNVMQSQPPCTGGNSWPDPLVITPQLI